MRLELQHVSIPMPPGGQADARAFYGGLLGLEERQVPPKLDASELVWFRVGGDLELHCFETGETPAPSQHFCLRLDAAGGGLDELRQRLEAAASSAGTRRRSSAARASWHATRSGTGSS
ncbi:MAG: hypothetical protein ABUS54_12970 [Actinomycetota bacterium]